MPAKEVVSTLKIVYAATEEQERYIQILADYFYSDIFPYYFSDEEIIEFEKWGVLSLQGDRIQYNGTMREAFQIITSFQALIAIIQSLNPDYIREQHRKLFERNAQLLERYGILFPFSIEQFTNRRKFVLSQYTEPNNKWLI